MNKYQEVTEARKLLEIPETANITSIKSSYRRLLVKWHPDKCGENQEACNEMVRKIISAYQTIMAYCHDYQYSFSEKVVKRHLTPEQWWFEHFGDDPLWGNSMKPK